MRVFLVVHGNVQGVGYRYLVTREARRNGITGMVKNMGDGSVHILASGTREKLGTFEKAINVSMPNGPQVFNIEKYDEGHAGFPNVTHDYDSFVVEQDYQR